MKTKIFVTLIAGTIALLVLIGAASAQIPSADPNNPSPQYTIIEVECGPYSPTAIAPMCQNGNCTNPDTQSLLGQGVACHPKMWYYDAYGIYRLKDWFYTYDEVSEDCPGPGCNYNVGWRGCDFIRNGIIVHERRGYLNTYQAPSYDPWHVIFSWDSRCPPPRKIWYRIDPDWPNPP